MNRNDVFLDAMGLGPQWRLRHAPAGLIDALPEEGSNEALEAGDAGAGAAGPVAHAADTAHVDHAEAAQPAGAAGPASVQGMTPAMPAGAGQAAAPAAERAGVAMQDGVQPPASGRIAAAGGQAAAHVPAAAVAGQDAASAPPPQAARPAPSPAAGDEDTSWFDDAPAAPAARPALKSSAPAKAPPPPKAAAPEAGGESYAWFDDVPATPVSKPARAPAQERESAGEADPQPAGRTQAAAPAPAAPRSGAKPAARQGPPADDIPWFDDEPMPSFDALPDDMPFDDHYGEEEPGVSAAAIARMDWPALRAAVQSCTRCGLCRERGAAVPGRGPEQAPWLVLGTAPSADDEAQARPLAGAPGQLLDNMLKAIDAAPERDVYVTTLVKCRPQGDRAPAAGEVAACRPYLEREIALAGTRTVLTLGHTAAKGLLGAAARGKVLRLQNIPVVATYHPADLLRKPEDKARAWADLCLARSAFNGGAA